MDKRPEYAAFCRLMVFAWVCALTSHWIAYDHEYSSPAKASSSLPCYANHLWIWGQGFVLTLPGLAVGCLLMRFRPSNCVRVGRSLMLLALAIHWLDVLAFTYYRDRLFSSTSARVFFDLSPSLAMTLNYEIVLGGIRNCVVGLLAIFAVWKITDLVSGLILKSRFCPTPRQSLAITAAILIVSAINPVMHWNATVDWMKRSSDRQPLFALGIFNESLARPAGPVGREALTSSLAMMSIEPELREREEIYRQSQVASVPETLPDILLVVIESMRHEVICEKTSPNLHKLAERGIWATNHFSTGNSTNVSMFSMLYGLESIWTERRRTETPALIRAARQCGYETGFFGGSLGWKEYHMDGFISPKNFDQFEIADVNWARSDSQMCDLAEDFLDQSPSRTANDDASVEPVRKPKLAILYLYGTHFDYQCEPVDKIHSPSLEGRLTLGYTVAERDQVWNRYLNSVHCVDRLLGPLMDPDRLICVVGDHGESFLEDKYRVHGVNISKYQNMTPCIVAGPGVAKAKLDCITSHEDIVPTLFDACGVEMRGDSGWEGASMLQMPLSQPRTIVTRDYVHPEIAIIDERNWDQPGKFGHRCLFSLHEWKCYPGNEIDECGVLKEASDPSPNESVDPSSNPLTQWLTKRFSTYGSDATLDEATQISKQLRSSDPKIVARANQIAAYLTPSESERLKSLIENESLTNQTEEWIATGDNQRKVR